MQSSQPTKKMRVPELSLLLQQKYLSGKVIADAPFASTRDIAQEFGVALLTADRAVKKLVDSGLLYRKPGSGTFVKGAAKKCLTVGVSVYNYAESSAFLHGADEAVTFLHEKGVQLRIISFAELKDSMLSAKMLSGLDGLLLSGRYLDSDTLKNLAGFSAPVGLIQNDYPYQSRFHQVIPDFSASFDEIVEGIPADKEIWLVYGNHPNGQYRRDEFLVALKRHDIGRARLKELSIDYVKGSDVKIYHQATVLAREARGKFIFCTSDQLSDTFLNAFIDKGLKPCVDFDWVGCDNLGKFGYGTPDLPGLTTVDCFAEEIVKDTAKIILDQIQDPSDCQIIARKPTQLIRRETARL